MLAPTMLKNVVVARSSIWPDFSIATMVFSKVGGAGLLAILSISASCCFMPCFDGRLVVAVLDLVERRRLKRQRAGLREGILGGAVAASATTPSAARLAAQSSTLRRKVIWSSRWKRPAARAPLAASIGGRFPPWNRFYFKRCSPIGERRSSLFDKPCSGRKPAFPWRHHADARGGGDRWPPRPTEWP